MLLFGLDPVLQLHVLLSELIEETFIKENHILGLLEVALELVVLQMPPIGLSLRLSHFLVHLGALFCEGSSTVLKGRKLLFQYANSLYKAFFFFSMS